MAYTDQNQSPGEGAVWNNMLGKWMHSSGNPYDVWESQQQAGGNGTPQVAHWPNASFGNNPSGAINQQNPTANPDNAFVQAGTTGGYLDGVGVTLGAGTSMTEGRAQAEIEAARAAGIPDEWINAFLGSEGRQDAHRLQSAYNSQGGGGSGSGGGSSSVSQQWNSSGSGGNGAANDSFLQMLMGRIGQSLTPDRNDPAIRAQADAFSANQERARRNYLSDLAERQGPYANLRGEQRMAAERYGQTTGAFEAELLGREVAARREEISQALALYGHRLSDIGRMALQRELADLDAQLRREGYGVSMYGLNLSNDQFLRSMAQRQYEHDNPWIF